MEWTGQIVMTLSYTGQISNWRLFEHLFVRFVSVLLRYTSPFQPCSANQEMTTFTGFRMCITRNFVWPFYKPTIWKVAINFIYLRMDRGLPVKSINHCITNHVPIVQICKHSSAIQCTVAQAFVYTIHSLYTKYRPWAMSKMAAYQYGEKKLKFEKLE